MPLPPTSNHPHSKLATAQGSLIYTETDEAPALATYSLLPILKKVCQCQSVPFLLQEASYIHFHILYIIIPAIRSLSSIPVHHSLTMILILTDTKKFGSMSDVEIIPCDISVAGRVLAGFPDKLKPDQRVPDNLAHLGDLCKTPEANVIKLPNVSASIPQLEACIAELRSKGYDVPLFPHEPKDEEEKDAHQRYSKVLGSAVNPVLREGNSDRRVAAPVKAYAQKNPHKMGIWSKASRTHVSSMDKGDFFGSEQSTVTTEATDVVIEHVAPDGTATILSESNPLEAGEVIDAACMNAKELQEFYKREIQDAKDTDIMLSLHLKATMMKVSDPILFGHCVKAYFSDAFEKHGDILESIGANPNNGLASVYSSLENKLPSDQAAAIKADFEACYENRPWLAMVNSDKGITNLHVPSDIIIDASMPVVIRDSGQMWNKDNELEDTKCLIPDRCYATIYQEMISYVKTNGQFGELKTSSGCIVQM